MISDSRRSFFESLRNKNSNVKNESKVDLTSVAETLASLKPAIYQMVKDKDGIKIEFDSNLICTPELILGSTKSRVLRFWKRFTNQEASLGVLNVGSAGSGKTLESDLLSNLCVLKGNFPVIKITGFNVTEDVVQYIQQLDNVCLYFDEFTKHVSWQSQRLLLPLLTNTNKKFLVLLTENSKGEISNFILNRTGRVRYIVEHDKLEKDVVLDYLTLFTIDEEFKTELLDRYDKALSFSFDNLMAIISEYQDYPDESLDDILKYLNITSIKKSKGYKLTAVTKKIKDVATGEEKEESVVISNQPEPLNKARLEVDSIWISYSNMAPSIKISKENLIDNNNDRLIFEQGEFKLTFDYI